MIMYRLDAEVEETTLFREPRALGCRRPERSEGATKGPRGSLNCSEGVLQGRRARVLPQH